jgi:hypothetical protein
MNASKILPEPELLQRLAINESGFVFDPVSGRSFTVNQSGFALIHLMRRDENIDSLIEQLTNDWNIDAKQAERDLLEFAAELRKAFKG